MKTDNKALWIFDLKATIGGVVTPGWIVIEEDPTKTRFVPVEDAEEGERVTT